MAIVRKNGKAYDSGDVVVNIDGTQEDEVIEIHYNTEQEHQLNFSLSNEATSWSMGKKTPNARLVLPVAAASRLEKKVPGGDLTLLKPFDINVTFLNPFNDIINDTVTCKFMGQGRAIDGGMHLKYEYPLFALGVNFNNA